MEKSLRGVVKIVVLIIGFRRSLLQKIERRLKCRRILFFGQRQSETADSRACGVRPGILDVTKTAIRRLAVQEKLQAFLNGLFRHGNAGVARGEKSDHLSAA